MRISDWSSDVCSSDLLRGGGIFALNRRAVDSPERPSSAGNRGPRMTDNTLVLGNKSYSSWSLRGWLAARLAGIPFEEVVIPLRKPATREANQTYSAAAQVPTRVGDGAPTWDTIGRASCREGGRPYG